MNYKTITDTEIDAATLYGEPFPDYMYTPYSDITEQEDFAAEYRRKIALLYFFFMPLSLLLISAISSWLLSNSVTSSILFFTSVCVFALGIPCFTFLGKFYVAHFLNLHIAFYIWPILPLMCGMFTVLAAEGNDAAFGSALVVESVTIMITNEVARQVSLATEEERLMQWPPLPGTDNDTYLHC